MFLLYMNDKVKKTFTLSPKILFRSPSKISSYMVRVKLYPLEATVESYPSQHLPAQSQR